MFDELPLISVIVPVYNVEKYLRECVESILAQSYSNIEVLLVDDGSTDESASLCDLLDREHIQVSSFHKENAGPSSARNFGIQRARGEWVSFIDADDYISPIYLETLYEAATSLGCCLSCVSGGNDFLDGDQCTLINGENIGVEPTAYSSSDFMRKMLYQEVTTGAQWRLYHRNLLGEAPFPEDIIIGEDLACMYKIVFRSQRVALVDCKRLYAYRHRLESLIRQDFRPSKAKSVLKVATRLYEDVTWMWPDLVTAAASRCFSICRTVYAQIPFGKNATEESRHYRSELWDVLSQHRKTVLFDEHARRRERLAAAIACLGEGPFTFFCRACRMTGLMQ